jgi:RES domain-containing protein
MSESRALALLDVLVHFAAEVPDRYVLGGADISSDLKISTVSENDLPAGCGRRRNRPLLARFGDRWVRTGDSAVLSVPSVVEERNFVLNLAHADLERIAFLAPAPFEFERLATDLARRFLSCAFAR